MDLSLITSLLSLAKKLLPSIRASKQATLSGVVEDLEGLMRTMVSIKANLEDAEERVIRNGKFKLMDIKKVASDALDVLSEYRYEVTRLLVEDRKTSQASGSHKRKLMTFCTSIDAVRREIKLKRIRRQFDVIEKDFEAFLLWHSDKVRCSKYKHLRNLTGHTDVANIFGREYEKMTVIDFLLSRERNPFSVISIVGEGGIGKTTIAKLVYKDRTVSRYFDLFGWVCASEKYDDGGLIKAVYESISKINIGFNELRLLQEELAEIVKGRTILLVLDGVWNNTNQSLWDLFMVPFRKAKLVRIIMTTRRHDALTMQSTMYFRLTTLPENSCWELFKHYAFSGTTDYAVPSHLVHMGKKIMRRCCGFPLAVKLIASLLRYTIDEEGWREILESDLWINPSNGIIPALQISYAHLPAHLKPCFLFCSMYPKDYLLEKMNLIELWISHGYIESDGQRRITEIGIEYYEELKERSFLDDSSGQFSECCKLHDIIHDLARCNSKDENYSVERNKPLDIQEVIVSPKVYHLYASGFVGYVNQILQQNLKGLRTLSMDLRGCCGDLEHHYCTNIAEAMNVNSNLSEYYEECLGDVTICNLTEFEALRVLELKGYNLTLIPHSISELKHLTYLGITSSCLKMLPSSIGLLYNLETLILDCFSLEYLPESIGDLANLQFLYIQSDTIKKLPKSLHSLGDLRRLVIKSDGLEEVPSDLVNLCNLHELTICCNRIQALPNTIGCLSSLEQLYLLSLGGSYDDLPNGKLDYVPLDLVNFPAIKTMAAWLRVKTIAWLKDMKDLEGQLSIGGLKNLSNLVDAKGANLRNKYKLETLDLCWDCGYYISPDDAKSELRLSLIPEACEGRLVGANDKDFILLEFLQPHPNLKKLLLRWYPSTTVPSWMKNPFILQSIEEVLIECCVNIQSLPFGYLHTLKNLTIVSCSSIRVLQVEQQLPPQLEKLQIVSCDQLEMITGLKNLNMLHALEIYSCEALKSLKMDELRLGESSEPSGDTSHGKPHIGQQSIPLLERCPDLERNLELAINETRNLWRWR